MVNEFHTSLLDNTNIIHFANRFTVLTISVVSVCVHDVNYKLLFLGTAAQTQRRPAMHNIHAV